jgi:hydrogenase maturation protein HypF
LPYDRPNTTMKDWALDGYCSKEYANPANRRFHAQPVACPQCGPGYYLHPPRVSESGNTNLNDASIRQSAEILRSGGILAVKGLGGYHLACDARNILAVAALRDRKYRKEKPFAVMVRDLTAAHSLVNLSAEAEALLTSSARPIVLARARISLTGVAPDNDELGVMLPYTPLHHLLFAACAPEFLVMTSANRSSEPIAYEDEDALQRLTGISDSFLIGQRQIARRVDDSVARAGTFGPVILRRSRGFAPGAVATLPTEYPVLALGANLKNTITLVVAGQAFVSQHIGDLDHYQSLQAFQECIEDMISMYEVCKDELLLVHDLHPQYLSTAHAATLNVPRTHAVQHHRAHVASVLAERQEWDKRVIGISFDGTGYGDDGSIWGGEIFVGSLREGFERVAHLRPALLAGGDAAAHHPVQSAAGFLDQIDGLPDVFIEPFCFPERYHFAMELVRRNIRTFGTTSIGRLFDAVAALLGFTREITYEGQAAIWLEQLARRAPSSDPYPFPFIDDDLDFRALLIAVAEDRARGRDVRQIARCFQRGIAQGLFNATSAISCRYGLDTVVLSGGVFQNELLLEDLKLLFDESELHVWTNHAVPSNDGGISLGQAALAAFGRFDTRRMPGDSSRREIYA